MELKEIITTGPSYSENQIYPQSSEKCKTCNLQYMYHRIKGWMKNDSDITRLYTFHLIPDSEKKIFTVVSSFRNARYICVQKGSLYVAANES